MPGEELPLSLALAALPDAALMVDARGRLLAASPAARELLQLQESGPVCLPAELSAAARACMERAAAGEDLALASALAVVVPVRGQRLQLELRTRPARDEAGGIAALLLQLRDPQRPRREEDLRYDLVATVAHELRTPLTSLHMSIHLCLEQAAGPLTAEQGILLSSAREDCERMRLLAEELLDMGRLASGRVALDLESIEAQELAQRAWSSFRPLAEDKGIVLEYALEEVLPAVLADRERVHRVLANLLSNALRHTSARDHVVVRARADPHSVRFEVEDSGEGIAPEHLPQVFEKFVRGPGSVHQGYGLGLCIARDIVAAHGGEIGVTSTLGSGSTFWFSLQRASPPSRPSGRLNLPG